MQAVLDAVWAHLLPASERHRGGRECAAVPRRAPSRPQAGAVRAQGRPPRRQDWLDVAFPVASGPAGHPGTPLTSVRLGMADAGHSRSPSSSRPTRSPSAVGTADWLVSDPVRRSRRGRPRRRVGWLGGRRHPSDRAHLSGDAAPDGHPLLAPVGHGPRPPGATGRWTAAPCRRSTVRGRQQPLHASRPLEGIDAEPAGERDQPVPAAARRQPGGLVGVGRGGVRRGARGATCPVLLSRRLRRLPLVPRHGARVVRGPATRRADERAASSTSRSTARSGPTSTRSTWTRPRR